MGARRASDLFLHEGRAPAARVDGRVQLLDAPETTAGDIEWLVERVLPAKAARERFAEAGDCDAGLALSGEQRFRVNIARQQGRLSAVARILPRLDATFASLGLPGAIEDLCAHARGLVLVTGATGSGKSTTLAAMVNHINHTRAVHIVTIEDPIEFVHADVLARVTQREVGSDTATFATALRQVVRQSPDVILVGELRDLETISVALSAALTGHLVLATLHTTDAVQTLQRVLSYFPEEARAQAALDLSQALRGIVSQRLLPRKDGPGRHIAVEMLTMSPAAALLLREQRSTELSDLMRADPGPGMVTFNESLLRLFKEGKIDFATGMAYASNPDEFALWSRGMTTGVDGFRSAVERSQSGSFDMRALLHVAMESDASDLHIAVGRPPILRLGGQLRHMGKNRLSDVDVRTLLFSIMSASQRTTYELEREVDFALALPEGRRFRVNAYYQKGRMAAALRSIPNVVMDAATLRLPDTVLKMGDRPHGLFLVVGPTGSGKSTTLACIVDRINRTRPCRIITVEDPVEYVHPSRMATVDQREVYSDTKSFAAALKYVLRQDPDVILVGEMRDLETIGAVLTAAETGHLVLATLHTNDAVSAVDRIIDVFPSHQQAQVRLQLAASLIGVVSQRLLPRKNANGRVAAYEVLVATPAIRNLIREAKLHQVAALMEASRREGCVTMDNAVSELLNEGLIAQDEAIRHMKAPRQPGGLVGAR